MLQLKVSWKLICHVKEKKANSRISGNLITYNSVIVEIVALKGERFFGGLFFPGNSRSRVEGVNIREKLPPFCNMKDTVGKQMVRNATNKMQMFP